MPLFVTTAKAVKEIAPLLLKTGPSRFVSWPVISGACIPSRTARLIVPPEAVKIAASFGFVVEREWRPNRCLRRILEAFRHHADDLDFQEALID